MVTARASSAMTHCIINQELAPKYITYSKVKTKQEKTRQKRVVWYLISSAVRRLGQQRHESTHHQEKSEIGGLSVAFAGLYLPALPAFGLFCRLPRHYRRSIRVSFFSVLFDNLKFTGSINQFWIRIFIFFLTKLIWLVKPILRMIHSV